MDDGNDNTTIPGGRFMRGIGQRRCARMVAAAVALAAPALLPHAATARFVQQAELIGTRAAGSLVLQGTAVALSADGNTALVGAPNDNGNGGAVWVFTRSNGSWQQQQILIGNGYVGEADQGSSVALSADGNTAIVGGHGDNTTTGAAWVFARSNGSWTQQGPKLVGTGATGTAQQGTAVALSADGNTALVGGASDNSSIGAAWVFTRSNGVWAQQGQKLVGSGSSGSFVYQGASVALSANGNVALVGGYADNNAAGAVWVFARSNGAWSQQGQKLVGTGAVGNAQQGVSVALAADGNTAVIGGYSDNSNTGAAWVFARFNGVLTQQGSKLVGTGAVGAAQQGWSVALSADGNTALVGGIADNSAAGAGWVFTRSIGFGIWSQQGQKLVATGAAGIATLGRAAALSADAKTALLGGPADNYNAGAAWVFVESFAGAHDFNGDGFSDIAWRDSGGNTALWMMNGAQVVQSGSVGTVSTNWLIAGQRDYNGDGTGDLLWRDTSTICVPFKVQIATDPLLADRERRVGADQLEHRRDGRLQR
jgi:hypothetical protein